MNSKCYVVAGHTFIVTDKRAQAASLAELLPSYAAFERSTAVVGLPVFSLQITDNDVPAEKLAEIGQFDCGGARHGVYRIANGGYLFDIAPPGGTHSCQMWAHDGFSDVHVRLRGDSQTDAFGLNNALMIAYAFSTAPLGTLLLHASVVTCQGRGYLFQGKSGTGKSTHSQLWLQHIEDTQLLNDDNPVVRVLDNGIKVYGTPWSGKTPCYRNLSFPIGAFLRLQQAPENAITQLGKIEAYASLLSSCSAMIWDRPTYSAIGDTVGRIATECRSYYLCCRPDRAAAILSHDTLFR